MNILNMEEWKQENSIDFQPLKEQHLKQEMPASGFIKLQSAMNKAKAENRRDKLRKAMGRYSATAAALVAVFVILPNTSLSVAHAMEQIPLLGQLVKAVTFREYQYEDERYRADITIPELVVASMENGGNLETTDTDIVAMSTDDYLPENTRDGESRNGAMQTADELSDTQLKETLQNTANEINEEIRAKTDTLINEFAALAKEKIGYQDLYVTSEVLTANEDYFTLKVFCYQGAGSGYQWNYYYTIDLHTGERMKLQDVFAEGADYITPISENIKEQMRAQMAADERIYYWLDHEIEAWNFKTITEDTSFYINAEGNVVIAFDEGDVGPMSTGAVEFVIPAEVLESIRR